MKELFVLFVWLLQRIMQRDIFLNASKLLTPATRGAAHEERNGSGARSCPRDDLLSFRGLLAAADAILIFHVF